MRSNRSAKKHDGFEKFQTLSKSWWLWGPIVVFAAMAVFVAGSIAYSGRGYLTFCFSSDCWEYFLNIYKIPLALLGLIIPAGGIGAALHRSQEAAFLYRKAAEVNRFGNYLKHREGFEKIIESYCVKRHYESGCKTYVETHVVYERLFPNASFDDPTWNGECDENYISGIERSIGIMMREVQADDELFNCYAFLKAVNDLQEAMLFSYSHQKRFEVTSNDGNRLIYIKGAGAQYHYHAILFAARDALSIYNILNGFSVRGNKPEYLPKVFLPSDIDSDELVKRLHRYPELQKVKPKKYH